MGNKNELDCFLYVYVYNVNLQKSKNIEHV